MAETTNRMLYPIPEAAELLGVQRSTIYRLVGEGEIERTKIGRRSLITATSIERYVDRLQGCHREA